MTFNQKNLYTMINAENAKIGSKGFFAQSIKTLKKYVANGHPLKTLLKVEPEFIDNFPTIDRFKCENMTTFLFYLAENEKPQE